MKTSQIMKDALETTHEITKLIKYSPKRDAKLEQIRKSSEVQLRCGIHLLCPTRWTIRADAMTSIVVFQIIVCSMNCVIGNWIPLHS